MKFEEYAQEANTFIKEIASELGNPDDTNHAYRVTSSVLQTLREMITPEESLHLISQLPMMLKAVYVNGWKWGGTLRLRSMEDFVQRLRQHSDRSAARDFGDDQSAIQKAKAVLRVMKRRINAGEIQHVIDQFPMELSELWLTEEKDQLA